MTLPRIFIILSVFLFGSILIISYLKKESPSSMSESVELTFEPIEVSLPEEKDPIIKEPKEEKIIQEETKTPIGNHDQELPEIDRIQEFFNKREPKLPIVETLTYKSHVPWLKGKPAWISDYSSHYRTSRHFIARSLNGKPDYEKQDVKEGDRFNVLNENKNFEFYLLISLSKSKMWFYYIDNDTHEKVLLKSYPICVGRADSATASGSLTPIGKYSLGDKIAIYRPKTKGMYQGEKIEMVRVFGTRWLPFGEEIENCSEPARGLGIHGLPLLPNEEGQVVENVNLLGKWESDGCIRLMTKDIEELFAIVISRRTVVELVK